jgi:hypothetical protein
MNEIIHPSYELCCGIYNDNNLMKEIKYADSIIKYEMTSCVFKYFKIFNPNWKEKRDPWYLEGQGLEISIPK